MTPAPTAFVAYDNRANIENITDKGLSLEAHWTSPWFGNAVLTSITGYRDWKDQSGSADSDATGADLLSGRTGNFTQFQQITQEFRYAGHTDRLDWLVGTYFKNSDLYLGAGLNYGTAVRPVPERAVLHPGPRSTGRTASTCWAVSPTRPRPFRPTRARRISTTSTRTSRASSRRRPTSSPPNSN